jgi:hypothetical protein
MSEIERGTTVRLPFSPIITGSPATGKTCEIAIIRQSDGQSWNGAAFAAGLTWNTMAELGATGLYEYSFTFPNSDNEYVIWYRELADQIFVEQDVVVREGKVIASIGQAIKDQTDLMLFNGSSEILAQTERLGVQAKADVNAEADQALSDYDPPTRTEATSDKNEIIAEVDENEVKIDTVIERTENLPDDPADESLLEAAIIASRDFIDLHLDTIEIKIDAIASAITQIQNNTKTVIVVPDRMVKPITGSKTYRFTMSNYDDIGNMEDFDSDPQCKIDDIDGTPILPYTTMIHDGTGLYHIDVEVLATDPNRRVLLTFKMIENTITRYQLRVSEITDIDSQLAEIEAKVDDIKIDTGTNLPGQIGDFASAWHIVDSVPKLITVPMNGTVIKTSDGSPISNIQTEIPVRNIDSMNNIGVIQIESELIFYNGRDLDESLLLNCIRGSFGTSGALHNDGIKVYQTLPHAFLVRFKTTDGQDITPTDIPVLTLFDENANIITSSSMEWDANFIAWRSYFFANALTNIRSLGYKMAAHLPGPVYAKIGGMVATIFVGFSGTGGSGSGGGGVMLGEFLFDQDGWIDLLGILHEWPDEYAGYVRDPTSGDRLQDVVIRAFRVLEDGSVTRDNNPPFQSITDIYGNFKGALDAGTFEFEFTRDGHVFFSVRREIVP